MSTPDPEKTQLHKGDPAPEFSLTDDDGDTVRLSNFRGRRVVVYFYPAALTSGCTTQACEFRDNLGDLTAAGVSVVGISRDPIDKLVEFRAKERLNFSLLSDPDKAAHLAYGVWGEKIVDGQAKLGVIRSTFLVGPAGLIEEALYGVKPAGHVAEVKQLLAIS
jgi:peroxiredoxin Q/BCP